MSPIDDRIQAQIREGEQVQRAEHEIRARWNGDIEWLFEQEFSHLYSNLAHARLRRALAIKKGKAVQTD
jgi:hypothetical protein